jgi:integrase/recombinase XerC
MRARLGDASASPIDQLRLFPSADAPTTRRELGLLGVEIMLVWAATGENPDRLLLGGRDVLRWCAYLSDPSLQEALALVGSHLDSLALSDLSTARMKAEIGRFVSELHLLDVPSLRDATVQHAETFMNGAVRGRAGREPWREPSPATVRLRRTALRTLYMIARHLGLAENDPTLDLRVAGTIGLSTRPLTDEEETLGRIASRMSFFDTRGPAIWALGQATATMAEAGRVQVLDVEVDRGRVRLCGTKKREPRWGCLSVWGQEQIAQRIAEIGGDADRYVVYDGNGGLDRPDSAVSNKLIEIFNVGGIRHHGVRPGSLPAWAGRRVFEESGRIEEVARALGVRSLDIAAEIIGWGWRDDATPI